MQDEDLVDLAAIFCLYFLFFFFFPLTYLYTKAYINLKQKKNILLESTKVKHNKHSFIFRCRREVDIECTGNYFNFMNTIYEGKFYILKLSYLTLSLHEAQMCTRTMIKNTEQQRWPLSQPFKIPSQKGTRSKSKI